MADQDSKPNSVYKESQTSMVNHLAAASIPIFILIIIIAALLHNKAVWSPYPIIPLLNITFLSIIMFFVSILAARSYLEGRSIPMLLLGCGTLVLGLGASLAGFELLGNNVNSTISIYNTSAFLSGVCYLSSVILGLRMKPSKAKNGWLSLLISYLAIFAVIFALVLLIQNHIWPVHFVQGSGATLFGLTVIYITIILFALSSILLLINKSDKGTNFRYWYGLGLGLIAVGLFGVSIQTSLGDALNWVGRISQYLGAIFILIAVISTIRQTGIWMLPWERALQESEERYKNIIDNVQDAYIRADEEGIVNMVSPSAARIYGFDSPNEMMGIHAISLYKNSEDRSFLMEELNKKSKIEDFESVALRKDGTFFPVSLNSQYYYDDKGQIQGTEAFVRDITERIKSKEALRESEEKYLNLFMNMTEEVHFWKIIRDDVGRIKTWKLVDVNPPTLKTWDKKLEYIKDKTTDEIFGPGSTEHYISIVEKVMDEGVSYSYEDYFPPLDRYFNFTTIPLEDYFITTGADISDIKKAQKKLQEAHDKLEIKVQERTAELDILVEELKRSNKELQSFAYITSHDLQEPLRTIASFTQLLERRYKGKLDADADEFMDYIVDAAKRMKDMIQGLLEYSRVDTQSEPFKEFESEKAVDLALNHLHSSIDESDAKITLEHLPKIIADENQMVRIFQNLIGKALKFRKEKINPEIHISAQKNDGEYLFSVSDNGIGMEDEYSKKIIFEPFRRLHTIDAYEGTGIGLAVVKRIIEHHGGRIWFESEL
ncbi:MAG: PAS domain S-box protein, partial [Methanobacterium sp.]